MNTQRVQGIKQLLNNLPSLKAALYVMDDLVWGLRLASGKIESNSGTTHLTFTEKESIQYIEEVFAEYKQYGLVEKFHGVAAELGPGDNAGVALLMRQDGCEQVDLIDRYFSIRNAEQQSRIYKLLAQRHPIDCFRLKDEWDEQALAGINWKIGQAAETYFQKCSQNQGQVYDFIVSRAVIEHLYDPIYALQLMVACLKPGGRILHEIDFRDHGMLTPTQHELAFLQIPSFIYRFMVRNSGRPNRILVHRYREALEAMKDAGLIDYSILVTNLVNVGKLTPYQKFEDIDLEKQTQAVAFVEQHRLKFAEEFRHISSQDLAVAGIFLRVTRK